MITIANRIKEALSDCYSTGEITALTRIIATELLAVSQMAFYMKDDVALTAEQETLLDDAITRLQKHEPIQYILGYSDFCGLRFKVTPATLIPRPETSELVEWIASEANGKEKILDIGTGSGCIAVSLAKYINCQTVRACDISEKAILAPFSSFDGYSSTPSNVANADSRALFKSATSRRLGSPPVSSVISLCNSNTFSWLNFIIIYPLY